MTNHSLPTGPNGPEGDSEKKKWGYKRQQFDAVVSTTRFNGAIDGLVNGTVTVQSLLGILDELNASNQRGRYMAEVLALKQESRRLATAPFDPRVAEFLVEGSRRIPWLSDGLASQMAVALASAADNSQYLDTVNTAVGNLLLDLDRPLKPDTRNFLRALTDKIDATRRLQEARGFLPTVPSVYPPAIPEQLANAKSPEPAVGAQPVEAPQPIPREQVLSVGESSAASEVVPDRGTASPHEHQLTAASPPGAASPAASDEYEELEPTAWQAGPQIPAQRTLVMPESPAHPSRGATEQGLAVQPSPPTSATELALREPAISGKPSRNSLTAGHGPIPVPSKRPGPRAAARSTAKPVPSVVRQEPESGISAGSVAASRTAPGLGTPSLETPVSKTEGPLSDEDLAVAKIPTSGIPIWAMFAMAGGLALGGLGLWWLARGAGPTNGDDAAAPSASLAASAKAPPAGSALKPPPATPSPVTPQAAPPPAAPTAVTPPAAPPPAAPPPATPPSTGTSRAPAKQARPATSPVIRTPAPASRPAYSAPQAIAKPKATAPIAQPPTPKQVERAPVTPKPKATQAVTPEAPVVPTTPKPSRTIDDILVELSQVPNDPAMIEAKAHEIARIVARSARPDAEHILQRLISEEMLVGTEAVDTRVLEPVRRVVALLLKKVALDKDDKRAAMAIDSLGEWAKLRKHGAAAKLTLDELAESPVVLSRPQRLRALERVQARLGISNVGE